MSKDDTKYKVIVRDDQSHAVLLGLGLRETYDLHCGIPLKEGGELVRLSYHKDGVNFFRIINRSGQNCCETPGGLRAIPPSQVSDTLRLVTWIWSGDMKPMKWQTSQDDPSVEGCDVRVLGLGDIRDHLPLAIDLWLIPKKGVSGISSLIQNQYSETHIVDQALVDWNRHVILAVISSVTHETWAKAGFSERVVSVIADDSLGIVVVYPGYRDTIHGVQYGRIDYARKREGDWFVGAAVSDCDQNHWEAPFSYIDNQGTIHCYMKAQGSDLRHKVLEF